MAVSHAKHVSGIAGRSSVAIGPENGLFYANFMNIRKHVATVLHG